ncbi:hypothetical protein P7C73_g4454, partial [Tremellales sp. Uapishka_1]
MSDVPLASLLENSESLKNKIILITEAWPALLSRTGLPTLIPCIPYALTFATQRAKVLIADKDEKQTTLTLSQLRSFGSVSLVMLRQQLIDLRTITSPPTATDVTDPQSIRNAFEHCRVTYGTPPDIVYANAGVSADDHFEEDGEVAATPTMPAHPRPSRDRTLAVNLQGLLSTCEIAREYWTTYPAAGRKLVLTASIGGISGIALGSCYSASKHATVGYWKGLCAELQQQGSQAGFECHVICPAFSGEYRRRFHDQVFLTARPPVSYINTQAVDKVPAQWDPAGPGRERLESHDLGSAAILLPDAAGPLLIRADEFDPFGGEWNERMNKRIAAEIAWQEIGPWTRWWTDVATGSFRTTPTALAIKATAVSSEVATRQQLTMKRTGYLFRLDWHCQLQLDNGSAAGVVYDRSWSGSGDARKTEEPKVAEPRCQGRGGAHQSYFLSPFD